MSLISQGDLSLATKDFTKELSLVLTGARQSRDGVSHLAAMPALNLSQWSAWINGDVSLPKSDDALFGTSDFAIQHVLPSSTLQGVPKRGESLITTTKADVARLKEELMGEHHSKLSQSSSKIR